MALSLQKLIRRIISDNELLGIYCAQHKTYLCLPYPATATAAPLHSFGSMLPMLGAYLLTERVQGVAMLWERARLWDAQKKAIVLDKENCSWSRS